MHQVLGHQDRIQTQPEAVFFERRAELKMLVLQEINPNVKNMKDVVFSTIKRRADQISKELREVKNNIWIIQNVDFISIVTLRSLF